MRDVASKGFQPLITSGAIASRLSSFVALPLLTRDVDLDLDDTVRDLLARMTAPKACDRVDILQALEHPWMQLEVVQANMSFEVAFAPKT